LTTLFDIFGYISVVLHGLGLVAQTVLIGSVSFALFVVVSLATGAQGAPELPFAARQVIAVSALTTVLTVAGSTALNGIVLAASLGASGREVAGAAFVIAGAVKAAGAVVLGVLAVSRPLLTASTRLAMGIGALLVLGAAVASSHAVAQLSGAQSLLLATGAHQLGAALWLGGLPCLWLALARRRAPQAARAIAARYSGVAITGLALIIAGGALFAGRYIGSFAGAYGTAYGAMATTKSVLFVVLLLLGAANFRAVRSFADDTGAMGRVQRFVEVEMGIGFAVLMAAASITSLPPAVDLVEDRVSTADIVSRMAPRWPRLSSPDQASLALPALQAQLDAEAKTAHDAARPQAFVPGGGVLPPRNAFDIAWSEYNHHWAGLLVLMMGLAALARRSGGAPWARHWPLLFLFLAAFLFLRADPEVWPMGTIGIVESLKDPEVVQHRVFEVLIVAFALFEWGVSTGRLTSRASARLFPVLVALGGTLLLTHSHALANVREELLIEWTHLPIAVLGVAAGWARWLEVEAPTAEGRWAGWVWPACFVAIGLLLLDYREA
jgi:putative copper resistance protein D